MEPVEHEPVDVRELGQNASRYVAAAEAGQRVPVTEHGKLVAYLDPSEEPTSILDRLEAAGRLRRATGWMSDLPPPLPALPGEPALSEVLRQMRDEERY